MNTLQFQRFSFQHFLVQSDMFFKTSRPYFRLFGFHQNSYSAKTGPFFSILQPTFHCIQYLLFYYSKRLRVYVLGKVWHPLTGQGRPFQGMSHDQIIPEMRVYEMRVYEMRVYEMRVYEMMIDDLKLQSLLTSGYYSSS